MVTRFCLVVLACWFAAFPPRLDAAELKAKPVTILLDGRTSVETLQLENSGNAPVRVQLRLFSWSQAGGEDRLVPTRDLVANPGIFEIAPDASQTVRIGRLAEAGPTEKSYRLFVDQIPDESGAGDGQIKVLLRLSLPIFSASDRVSSKLRWQVRRAGPDRLTVAITNEGTGEEGTFEGLLYVLPGATRYVSLPYRAAPATGEPIDIIAGSDAGDISARSTVEAAPHAESGS